MLLNTFNDTQTKKQTKHEKEENENSNNQNLLVKIKMRNILNKDNINLLTLTSHTQRSQKMTT